MGSVTMPSTNHFRTARNIAVQNRSGIYQGQLGEANSDRYYKLRFNQRSSVNLSLSGLQADANLSLLDRNGKTLSKSARSGQVDEKVAYAAEPGTYYVRVFRQQGATHYRLNLAVNAVGNRAAAIAPPNESGSLVDQVVEWTNFYREQAGAKPLSLNPLLTATAQAHSQDMADNDFFGHNGSNGSTVFDRVGSTGYDYFTVSENIAAGFALPKTVVEGWMNSPEHRANLLNPTLKEIGVGFSSLENDGGNAPYHYYWTQDFGAPMS
jgi:uncharacterized protein YkwD